MNEGDSVRQPAGWPAITAAASAMAEAVPVDVGPEPAAVMTEAGEGWFGPGLAVRAARLVVGAWAMAVDGDESVLRAISAGDTGLSAAGKDDNGDPAYCLLHPAGENWVIAPGAKLASIDLWRLDRGGDAPELGAAWRFTAYQRCGLPVIPPGWTGPGEKEYVGSAYLTFHESLPWPWRLTHGHVETIDEYYGYKYVTRDEAPEEYRARTGSTVAAVAAVALVPSGTYRLLVSYAEHDHKFSGDAASDVDSDVPLTREEAQRLAESAVEADAKRRIGSLDPGDGGEMEVHPSLSCLQVIRLLARAPQVVPSSGAQPAAS